jgi:TPR repeat protein
LDLAEALGDLFKAATNHIPQACADLSGMLQHGTGIPANMISAYAWMELATEQDRSYAKQLDQLVVQMSPGDVQEAQEMAVTYSKGRWPTDLARPVDDGDPRLKIKGITLGGRSAMVVLNRVTFTEGDTMDVVPDGAKPNSGSGNLTVTCREIGDNYVLVSIAGEPHLKLLSAAKLLE